MIPNNSPPSRAVLRAYLDKMHILEFESFALDCYKEIQNKFFTQSMSRMSKTNILLEKVDERILLIALQTWATDNLKYSLSAPMGQTTNWSLLKQQRIEILLSGTLAAVICVGLVVGLIISRNQQGDRTINQSVSTPTNQVIRPRKVDSLKVLHVRPSHPENGSKHFEIKIGNNGSNEESVKELSIEARIPPYQEYGCGQPPDEIFKIDEKVVLTSNINGHYRAIESKYKDIKTSAVREYRAVGEARIDGCMGAGLLKLKLQTMFQVQPDSFFVVDVLIPSKLRIVDSHAEIPTGEYSVDDRDWYAKTYESELRSKPNIKNFRSGSVRRLGSWRFCFLTTNDSEFCSKEL